MKLINFVFTFLKWRVLTDITSLVLLYSAMLETAFLLSIGDYWQLVHQLLVWAFAKVTLCCLVDLIIDGLLIILLPSVDGYCYTALFNWRYRLNAYRHYGKSPRLKSLSNNRLMDCKATFAFQLLGESHLHVWRRKGGLKLDEIFLLQTKDEKLRVGTEEINITPLWIYQFLQQGLRVATWIAAIGYFQTYSLAVIPMIWICYHYQLDNVAPTIPLFAFLLWNKNFIAAGFISAAMSFATYYGHIMMVKHVKACCQLRNQSAPTTDGYPNGIDARGLTFDFSPYRNSSPIYEKADFIEDTFLKSNDRDILTEETGLTKMDSRGSGNPHRLAALTGRYFKWLAARELGWIDVGYKIIIGGTFKGHACSESGLAVQPPLTEGDSHNLRHYPTREGYGQVVLDAAIGTKTKPIGSIGEEFNPEWNVDYLGGADIWMTHVYDIPIKALLAIADANRTETVNVVMHATPSLFEDISGELPFTGQEFCVDGSDYQFKWKNTSGKTYRHNRRVYYEHFFTSYVCTSPGVWYVSEIPRQVMDVYWIRWTRQNSEPEFQEERRLVIRPRKNTTYVPAGAYDPVTKLFKFSRVQTEKQLEEYIHKAKNIGDLSTNCRALTDNLFRNKGIDCPHFRPITVLDVYTAEENRRALVELATKPKYYGILEYFGLKPDPRLTSSLARAALSCLVKQPPTEVTKPMLRQSEPYIKTRVAPRMAGPRYYPLHNYSNGVGLVSQIDLDMKCPSAVVKLFGKGRNMCEQLCHCLFGTTTGPTPILPLGTRCMGGSELSKNGTQILDTEIEHLITFNDIIFVAKFRDQRRKFQVEYCGNVKNSVRQLVVYIDYCDNKVSLVHRPIGLETSRLMIILGARGVTFNPNKPWFQGLRGTDREYVINSEASRLIIGKTEERMARDERNGRIHNRLADDWTVTYDNFICLDNNKFTIVHDAVRLTPDNHIVAHLYAHRGVNVMRSLYARTDRV